MSEAVLKPVAWRILEKLARYRFLNVRQFVAAGAGDEKVVRTRLRDLAAAGYIDLQEFRLGRNGGTLPSQYWLLAKGAKALAGETGEQPLFPSSPRLSPIHLAHRMITIDALIAADRWAQETGQDLPEHLTYMVRTGDKTWQASIPALNRHADALLKLHGADGKPRTYVLEVYCALGGKSTTPAQKIEPYVQLGMSDVLDNALAIPPDAPAAKILVVCDTPELRDRLVRSLPLRDGMPDLRAPTWGRFRIKAASELADFGNGWHRVGGGEASLPVGDVQ